MRRKLIKFIKAYNILCKEVYLPEKYRKGYVSLIKKVGKIRDDAPMKLKLLQYKIELDGLLDELTEEIYKKVKLD